MAENEGVKLLGMWGSPFSRRIEMALKLKGVPYEYVEEDFINKSPLLLKLNPVYKKVPVLVHAGKPITESLVILEYIDETWKNRPVLHKDDLYQRAMARFWAKFVDEQVFSKGFIPIIKAEVNIRETAIEEEKELIKLLENELVGKDFFGGETVGFLDFVISTVITFLTGIWEALEVEVISKEKFPEIYRWTKRLSEINEVKECIPPRDEYTEHMKDVVQMVRSS